jgi:hypothetical protein
MWCKKCKTNKPEAQFLRLPGSGWKVRFCNRCAGIGMASYWRIRATVKNVAKIALEAKE